MKKLLPLIIILCASCSKDVLDVTVGDPFNSIQNTSNITVPNYSYLSDSLGIVINVSGDANANQLREEFGPDLPVPVPYLDSLSADLVIQWVPVSAKFIAAGIFKEKPNIKTIDGNGINNSADCVWLWNNGMGTGAPGEISFINGKSITGISNGEPVYANQSVPLTKSKTYYLMMWAWNEDATKIKFSSKLIRIVIKEK